MTGPVLAAVDGRSPAALRLGVLLARTLDRELLLTTAYEADPPALGAGPPPPAREDPRMAAAERTLEEALRHVPADVSASSRPLPAVETAKALAALAAEVDAPVVVVGPDERGQVTESLLDRLRCPVAVAPIDPLLVPDRLGRIGAAFDGSEPSKLAFTAAARLGLAAEAPVVAVAVAASDEDRDRLEGEATRNIPRDRQEVDLEVRLGEPARELRRAAERLDLLACGSRGRGPITRALLGSVSRELVAQPPCAVLVVGRDVERDTTRPLGLTGAGSASA